MSSPRRVRPLLVLALPLLTVALFSGCLVTDELEFDDLVNNPPQVVSIEPSNSFIQAVCNDVYEYTLTVWDADEADVGRYDAKIYLWPTPNPTTATNPSEKGLCSTEQLQPGEDGEDDFGSGVTIFVTCSLDLKFLGGVDEYDIMLTKVVVSDRQFIQQTVPDDARTAEVFWTLQLLPDDQCEDQ